MSTTNLALVAHLTVALRNATFDINAGSANALHYVYGDTKLSVNVQDINESVMLTINNDHRALPTIILRNKTDIPEIVQMLNREIAIADAGSDAAVRNAERDAARFQVLLNRVAGKLDWQLYAKVNDLTVFSSDFKSWGGESYLLTVDSSPNQDGRLRFFQSNNVGGRIDGIGGIDSYTGNPDEQGIYAAISRIREDILATLTEKL